jgi:hypothetical protein
MAQHVAPPVTGETRDSHSDRKDRIVASAVTAINSTTPTTLTVPASAAAILRNVHSGLVAYVNGTEFGIIAPGREVSITAAATVTATMADQAAGFVQWSTAVTSHTAPRASMIAITP